MPVGTTEATLTYKMDGIKKAFDFPFHVDTDSDVRARVDDGTTVTALVFSSEAVIDGSSDYNVSLNSNLVGGILTLGSAFDSGFELTIYREVGYLQSESFVDGEPLNASAYEDFADKSTMQMQQLSARIEEQNV